MNLNLRHFCYIVFFTFKLIAEFITTFTNRFTTGVIANAIVGAIATAITECLVFLLAVLLLNVGRIIYIRTAEAEILFLLLSHVI